MKIIVRLKKMIVLTVLLVSGVIPIFASGYTDNFTGGRTDFRDETIYFMITTRFYDGDPKNNVLCWDNQTAQISTKDPCWRGDFKGVIDKLDYIKALGFTAIWITPVVQNASGYDYHGYHAMDFTKVDCRYESHTSQGSSEDVDFQTLIDKAHAKGIKIILDIVLNHSGNFGEETLCKEFTRNTNIKDQADIDACMEPTSILNDGYSTSYADLEPADQYGRRLALMKNTDGVNHDSKNYWHHFGNFNWDNNTRWYAQIAGDCVDLNTENPATYKYLRECYASFIKMGVDGFRIDTSGHIAKVTFNNAFIPYFTQIGDEYKSKRLNNAPFYMFGEVCSRYSDVIYRGQDALSPFFYTWKGGSYGWTEDESEWNAEIKSDESLDFAQTNLKACEAEYAQYNNATTTDFQSDNAFLDGNPYHTPDYSKSSGFNVIDFPMHYNFSNAASAVNIAKSGDNLYNDPTYNVVYVDSHDYGPQPNDNIRFSGSDSQWAENLSLMFTFRGIPCLYYGSEIGFRRGQKIDNGTNGPLSDTGRAYFGGYVTGDVTASDFGTYTASGNVAATLDADLSQHIIRLNKIRAAIPALRKGQYSWDGCTSTSGYAFKRRYTSESIDSYALIALNSGATFTGVLNGDYTDVVTGNNITVSDGTLTTESFSGQGNLRVYVLNGSGKIGGDGKFIYGASSVSKSADDTYDGNQEVGTDSYYTADDATSKASVALNPNGGSFKTETQDVTVSLSDGCTLGWYQIGNGDKVTLTDGTPATFTIGYDMSFGDTKTVNWGATNDEGTETTGSATYKKVDPNATITIYCKASTAPNLYAWSTTTGSTVELNGAWPGKAMSATTTVNGTEYYSLTFSDVSSINIIFNNGSTQTADINSITADSYYSWDGGTGYVKLDGSGTGEGGGTTPSTDVLTAYFIAPASWTNVYCWCWDASNNYTGGSWPGVKCTNTGTTSNGLAVWKWTYNGSLTTVPSGIIFSNNGTQQTADFTFVNGGYYNIDGTTTGITTDNTAASDNVMIVYTLSGQVSAEIHSLDEIEYTLRSGIYIVNGRKYIVE